LGVNPENNLNFNFTSVMFCQGRQLRLFCGPLCQILLAAFPGTTFNYVRHEKLCQLTTISQEFLGVFTDWFCTLTATVDKNGPNKTTGAANKLQTSLSNPSLLKGGDRHKDFKE